MRENKMNIDQKKLLTRRDNVTERRSAKAYLILF